MIDEAADEEALEVAPSAGRRVSFPPEKRLSQSVGAPRMSAAGKVGRGSRASSVRGRGSAVKAVPPDLLSIAEPHNPSAPLELDDRPPGQPFRRQRGPGRRPSHAGIDRDLGDDEEDLWNRRASCPPKLRGKDSKEALFNDAVRYVRAALATDERPVQDSLPPVVEAPLRARQRRATCLGFTPSLNPNHRRRRFVRDVNDVYRTYSHIFRLVEGLENENEQPRQKRKPANIHLPQVQPQSNGVSASEVDILPDAGLSQTWSTGSLQTTSQVSGGWSSHHNVSTVSTTASAWREAPKAGGMPLPSLPRSAPSAQDGDPSILGDAGLSVAGQPRQRGSRFIAQPKAPLVTH